MFLNISLLFLLPRRIQELGGDEAQIGLIMGSFGLTSLVTIPWVSRRIDRHGSRTFMLAGLILMASATVGYAFIDRMTYLFVPVRLLQGIAFAMMFNGATTAVTLCLPQARMGQGLGIFGAFTIASHAIGPALAEQLVDRVGFTLFFPVAAVSSLLALPLTLKVPAVRREVSASPGVGFFGMAGRRDLLVPLGTALLMGTGFGGVLNFLAAYTAGLSLKMSDFFLTYSAMVFAVRLLGGRASDRAGRDAVVLPSLLVSGLGLFGLSFIQSQAALLWMGIVYGLGHGLLYPTLNAQVVDRTGPHERGIAMGVYNASFTAGVNFCSFGLGALAKHLGFGAMYVVCGAGLWVAAVLVGLNWLRRRRREAP
jgi:MFS family permease